MSVHLSDRCWTLCLPCSRVLPLSYSLASLTCQCDKGAVAKDGSLAKDTASSDLPTTLSSAQTAERGPPQCCPARPPVVLRLHIDRTVSRCLSRQQCGADGWSAIARRRQLPGSCQQQRQPAGDSPLRRAVAVHHCARAAQPARAAIRADWNKLLVQLRAGAVRCGWSRRRQLRPADVQRATGQHRSVACIRHAAHAHGAVPRPLIPRGRGAAK